MTEVQARAFAYFTGQNFLPVNLDSFSVFKGYDGGNIRLHETTAAVSVIWGFAFHALYKIILGYLCSIWFYQNNEVYIIVQWPQDIPRGSVENLINILYTLSCRAGLSSLKIWAVEEHCLKEYENIPGYDMVFEYSDDWSEYAYHPQDILKLSGRDNFNKRNRIKKFIDRTDISVHPMNSGNIGDCLEIEKEWCLHQNCDYCGSFAGCEKKSLELMIELFNKDIFQGIFICSNNTPAGFAIWEKNAGLAFVYFVKSNVPNFNIFLYYILVRDYLSDVVYINIGHDMGKPGLRTFKQHLSSHELWRKYLCTFTPKGRKT
jgi:hypothetical protein